MKKIIAIISILALFSPTISLAADSHSANWGTTAYSYAADSATLGLGASADATFEFWYYPTDQPTGDYLGYGGYDVNSFLAKWEAAKNREYGIAYGYDGTNYEICFAMSDDGSSSAGHYKLGCADITAQLPTNQWSYVATVYTDSSGTWEVFVGDESTCPVSAGSDSGYFGAIDGNSQLEVARDANLTAMTADGYFGEVRIWRTAKTAAELGASWAPSTVSSGTNLLEVWEFNNVWTATVNGNDLTTVNSPTFTTTIPTISASCGGGGGGTPAPDDGIIFFMYAPLKDELFT